MNQNREQRIIPRATAEFRIEGGEDGKPLKLTGRAVPFDAWSTDLFPNFKERIERGAFEIKDRDILVTFEHSNAHLLGRTSSKTARLTEKKDGIYYEVDLPETEAGRSVAELVKRGDLQGNSFEFSVHRAGDEWNEEGTERTIKKGELYQVGPVANPAYEANTDVALRSREKWQEAHQPPVPTDTLGLALDIEEAAVVD